MRLHNFSTISDLKYTLTLLSNRTLTRTKTTEPQEKKNLTLLMKTSVTFKLSFATSQFSLFLMLYPKIWPQI